MGMRIFFLIKQFMLANTEYQDDCEEEWQCRWERDGGFALVKRWIDSQNLGIGLLGICDGKAKEGGLRTAMLSTERVWWLVNIFTETPDARHRQGIADSCHAGLVVSYESTV